MPPKAGPPSRAKSTYRGRPTAGSGYHVGVRLQPDALAALDAWIARHARNASRPEAIRALIELGMKIDGDLGE